MKVPPGGGVCCESSVSGVSCGRCTPRMKCSTFFFLIDQAWTAEATWLVGV